jgi:MFS family permease
MVERFSFTNSNLADLALYMGIFWAIGSGYLNQKLLPYFSTVRILEFCLFIFPFLGIGVGFSHHLIKVLLLLAASVVVGGLAWPLCSVVISNAASKESQGKILGLSQSVQSLSMTIAPLIGGITFQISLSFPFLVGALGSVIAGILYFALKEEE